MAAHGTRPRPLPRWSPSNCSKPLAETVPPGQRQHRHSGHDLDALHDPRRTARAVGAAMRAAARWSSAVRRARPRAGSPVWRAGERVRPRPCVASSSRAAVILNRKIDDLISGSGFQNRCADECGGCQGHARIHFYTKVAPGLRDDGNYNDRNTSHDPMDAARADRCEPHSGCGASGSLEGDRRFTRQDYRLPPLRPPRAPRRS